MEAIFDTDFHKLSANSWSVALGELGELVVLVPEGCTVTPQESQEPQ